VAASARMVDVIDRFAHSLGVAVSASHQGQGISGRWAALRAAGVDRPGLRFAAWVDVALIGGVIPPLLANCPDVETLLDTLVRFHPLWGDDSIVVGRGPDGSTRVRLQGPGDGEVHPDTSDAFVALFVRLLGQVTSPAVRPIRSSNRSAGRDEVVVTPAQMKAPLAAADPQVAGMLRGYAEGELGQGAWMGDVRREIRATLAKPPALRAVAARLACSPRTLQQRLAAESTTFSALVDDERRLRSVALLNDPGVTVSTVAFAVGFQSDEGFSRAFRRWTGTSPTGWRRANRREWVTPVPVTAASPASSEGQQEGADDGQRADRHPRAQTGGDPI
jgi:AraC-like DNA-binding protein